MGPRDQKVGGYDLLHPGRRRYDRRVVADGHDDVITGEPLGREVLLDQLKLVQTVDGEVVRLTWISAVRSLRAI